MSVLVLVLVLVGRIVLEMSCGLSMLWFRFWFLQNLETGPCSLEI